MTKKLYRIAVCLSGESRTYKVALDNIKYYFANIISGRPDVEVVVDYFLHTWDSNTWKSHKTPGHNPEWAGPDIIKLDIDLIKTHLNVIDYHVDAHLSAAESGLWKGLFYSAYYSNHLKRKHELAEDFEYDMVFKHRMDIALNPNLHFHIFPLADYMIYNGATAGRMPIELNYYNFCDVIYYGTSFTMDLLCDISRYLIDKTPDTPMHPQNHKANVPEIFLLGPGALLYQYMTKLGFNPAVGPRIEYSVIRREVFDSNIHTVNEYDLVKKIHRNF
jgi:hypothetical protein